MITVNYSDRQAPRFRVLSDDQCDEIYQATLECLQRVGVKVPGKEAKELLASAGAYVEGDIVHIPSSIIQNTISVTPRTFTIWGRDHKHFMQIAPDKVHFGPGLTNTYFIDPETNKRRKTRRGDPALTALVCDCLENIDYVMGLGLISDINPNLAPVYEFAEIITHTSKPLLAWAYNIENITDIYKIAVAVAGSEEALRKRPIFALFSTFQAPLQHTKEDVGNIMWAAEHYIPVVYLGGPTVGLTSPATGASSLVTYLAGALSGLAIIQLKRQGTPTVIGCVPSAMDLRTARPSYGSPEMSLYSAAAADLSRYLRVPFMSTAGASESKLLDSQAAIESSIQVLMSALSGAALVHDVGFLDCADIGSLPLLVMVDEIIGMVKRMLRGVEVNKETIMLDLIEQVGPDGHFASEPRSASLCRKEIWLPKLMDRNSYHVWKQEGKKSMKDRVMERLQGILSSHQPWPLPEDTTARIDSILADAEKRCRS